MTTTITGHAAGTNGRFDTGVVNQAFSGGTGRDNLPCEPSLPSLGACGSRQFSVPQLFNVKHLTPLFHDASAADVATSVVFYNSPAFNNSPAGLAVGGINMPAPANGCVPATASCTMIQDITAFLESLVARSLTANSATMASGFAGGLATPAPSVVVRDDAGNPLAGTTVTFSVTGGGGIVTGGSAVSNASGIAALGAWVLGAGVNTLSATLDGATGSPLTFSAFGSASGPTLSLDRGSLNFSGISNGAAFVSQTGTQAVRLTQAGSGTVTWTATANQPWLTVSPSSGSGSAVLTVGTQFVPALPAASTGAITITVSGAGNVLPPIAVVLTVLNSGTSTGPVGAFDTPLDGSGGITGSLAVTGWAIDDVQVTRIRIVRDAVAGEPAGAQIYLGDGSFVDGARPDVAAAHPGVPLNTRAGWGYLLLSNFLPNLGTGTFRISAYADDAEGNATLLGTKTVTCTNSTATAPFGAIDTPGQGETVSGIVNNFGWVLSPGARRASPVDGGSVSVIIDGSIVGSPSGWNSRSDLTALFPAAQFSGIASAMGVYSFDSTTLSNGIHTIAWIVTDNSNPALAAGVGSRYFTVSNGSGLQLAPARRSAGARTRQSGSTPSGLEARRGFDLDAPFTRYVRGADGVFHVHAEELDRIELVMPGATGFLQTAGGRQPLPIGSRLDAATFTWNPGAGFLGAYDFVFERGTVRQRVRITIHPQGTFTRAQIVIDLPAAGSEIDGSMTVAGWALDPTTNTGTGISTIHVWAIPFSRGAPVFMGSAALLGRRPDVAAVYGAGFQNSGFGLQTPALPPGTYDIAVFAWSDRTGDFLPAKVVRVTVRE